MKVKICGIRSLKAAKAAVDAGADFLGFNFVPSSRRYILPEKAKEIIDKVKGKVSIVGVFQNEHIDTVNKIAKDLSLDFVQLHGDETPRYFQKLSVRLLKVISVSPDFSVDDVLFQMELYKKNYYMLDRKIQGVGRPLSLERAALIAQRFHLFLAGGLTPETVVHAVRMVNPFAVDVASGIETDGKEDIEKIKLFIHNAKGAIV